MGGLLVSTITLLLLTFSKISIAGDTVTRNQPLTHNQTLVSSGQTFELGFFSPDDSNSWYLGIWYKNIQNHTVVWVANRDDPLQDSSGVVKINDNGSLAITNRSGSEIWSTLNPTSAQIPIAQLLDSGNLVLKNEGEDDPESYIWQSFDHPTDTLIAGMKLGWDFTKGLNRNLTSWKSSQDPSSGEFTASVDPHGYPQIFILKGSDKDYRTGPWNGLQFSGLPEIKDNLFFTPIFVADDKEVYYTFNTTNSAISRRVLSPSGGFQRFNWNNDSLRWELMSTLPDGRCDHYGLCGAHTTCDVTTQNVCKCLKRFSPTSPQAWSQLDWIQGCKRRVNLDCNNGDGFVKYTSLKLPDTSNCLVNKSMTTEECRRECLKYCSCMAYSNSDIREEGSGCLMWFGELIDTRELSENGQDLYVRMAASELPKVKKSIVVIIVVFVVLGMLLLGSIIFYFIWKARMKQREQQEKGNLDLPLFDFDTIASATSKFSNDNKLGEGGFGPVYKGILSTGQEIAAKRLSQKSGQGLDEFKNEVIFIAKLQHRNLVRLVGCCIQREEKMLIYEYMPNNSLDSFLFDQARSKLLNWDRRFHIAVGIAQGLLYLHRDSRLRIIHRDLKASNILLDSEMNPKISDFGIARTFRGDQTEADTRKVIGTYGYMAPEYAIEGRFSMKSDVFSFGVLVLEIVSGKKNRGFYHPDHNLNLLGHAWNLWNESKALELVDALIADQIRPHEALRLIQVGLLCVQQHPEDRPNMSSVVLMLCSESVILPKPKQPGFYSERCLIEGASTSSGKKLCSYDISLTLTEGR